MSGLGRIACVFLSFMGSLYCLWILCDCWKQARASREAGEPPAGRSRRKAIADRIEWHCQILFAGTFLAVAVVLITGNVRHVLSHLAQNITGNRQQGDPVLRLSAQKCPSIFFDRDSTRPGQPIVGIDCARLPVSDEFLRELLPDASELDWLTLSGTQISDDLLRDLGQLRHLSCLVLDDTQITDTGLRHLAAWRDLEALSLDGTQITDDGLQHVARLRGLRELYLCNTAITDRGLEYLLALKHLERLSIDGTRITDDGLRHVAEMRNLTALGLHNTAITGRGLGYLLALKHLKQLSIDGTRTTDARLLLYNPEFTDRGMRPLQHL